MATGKKDLDIPRIIKAAKRMESEVLSKLREKREELMLLKKERDSKKATLQNMEQELETLKKELEDKEVEEKRLIASAKRETAVHGKVQQIMDHFKSRVDQCESKVATVEYKNEALQIGFEEFINEMKASRKQNEDEFAKIAQNLKSVHEGNTNLKVELKKRTDEIETIQGAITVYSQAIDQKVQKRDVRLNETAKLAKTRTEYEKEKQLSHQALKAIAEQLVKFNVGLKTKVAEIVEKLQVQGNRIESLNFQKERVQAFFEKVKSDLYILDNMSSNVGKEIAQKKAGNETLRREIEERKAMLEDRKLDYEFEESKISLLRLKVKKLKEENDTLETKTPDLSKFAEMEKSKFLDEIKIQDNKLKEVLKSNSDLEKVLAVEKEKLSSLLAEKKAIQKRKVAENSLMRGGIAPKNEAGPSYRRGVGKCFDMEAASKEQQVRKSFRVPPRVVPVVIEIEDDEEEKESIDEKGKPAPKSKKRVRKGKRKH